MLSSLLRLCVEVICCMCLYVRTCVRRCFSQSTTVLSPVYVHMCDHQRRVVVLRVYKCTYIYVCLYVYNEVEYLHSLALVVCVFVFVQDKNLQLSPMPVVRKPMPSPRQVSNCYRCTTPAASMDIVRPSRKHTHIFTVPTLWYECSIQLQLRLQLQNITDV